MGVRKNGPMGFGTEHSGWAEILIGTMGAKRPELFRNVKILSKVRQIGPHWDTWYTFQVVHTKWYTSGTQSLLRR